jgi:hypothetical protein
VLVIVFMKGGYLGGECECGGYWEFQRGEVEEEGWVIIIKTIGLFMG